MTANRQPAPAGPTSAVRVQIFRVVEGSRHRVRMLADAVGGILTHWQGGQSRYCPGDGDCLPALHRLEKIWKGYTPVEVWDPAGRRWVPWVLEVTEALEHDFRGVLARGQVWELTRMPSTKKKRFPVEGVLIEQGPTSHLRPAFDMRPVLYRLFHVTAIELSVANPMPAPLVLEIEGPPVEASRTSAKRPEDLGPAEREKVLHTLRAARGGIGRELSNGKTAGGHP